MWTSFPGRMRWSISPVDSKNVRTESASVRSTTLPCAGAPSKATVSSTLFWLRDATVTRAPAAAACSATARPMPRGAADHDHMRIPDTPQWTARL